jgi:ABC-type sugar transport system permease subunit
VVQRDSRVQRAALMFLLPAFLAFSLFSWYPMLKGLMISLFAYAPAGVSTVPRSSSATRT